MQIRNLFCLILFLVVGCSKPNWTPPSVSTKDLTPLNDYRIVRVITHLHTPYSYDACDKQGLVNGVPNANCLAEFRRGLCDNQVDFAMLTDHPEHMAETDFKQLLLYQTGDKLAPNDDAPVSSTLGGCAKGNTPQLSVGFEGALMPVLMESQIEPDVTTRLALYQKDDSNTVARLRTESNGLIMIPHTEHWSIDDLQALAPDGIEVYNLHANLDPKIRAAHLEIPSFDPALNLLPYYIDPYRQEIPDLAFIGFMEWSPVYARIWDALLARYLKFTALSGCDSHENTLSSIAWDDERLDAHRRLMHWVTEFAYVKENTFDEVKTAFQNHRVNLVFEGFGTPDQFEFTASTSTTTAMVGETLPLEESQTRIRVKVPNIHAGSFQPGYATDSAAGTAQIKLVLRKISIKSQNSDIVAEAVDQSIDFGVYEPGIYRAEVWIRPKHLSSFLNYDYNQANLDHLWILSNPIWIEAAAVTEGRKTTRETSLEEN